MPSLEELNGRLIKAENAPSGGGADAVPPGGTTGQVLSKVDDTDFNTQWVDPPSGGGSALSPILSWVI